MAFINSIKKRFPNSHLVDCLFYYKQALKKHLSSLGFYKREYLEYTEEILNLCGKLPFIINNKNNLFNKALEEISNSYKDFYDYFIERMFTLSKINNLLDYMYVSKFIRTNSFIEN